MYTSHTNPSILLCTLQTQMIPSNCAKAKYDSSPSNYAPTQPKHYHRMLISASVHIPVITFPQVDFFFFFFYKLSPLPKTFIKLHFVRHVKSEASDIQQWKYELNIILFFLVGHSTGTCRLCVCELDRRICDVEYNARTRIIIPLLVQYWHIHTNFQVSVNIAY